MGKRFDNFKELADDMNMKLENGVMSHQTIERAYMSLCAGYLACIVDKLDEITSKLEDKENKE